MSDSFIRNVNALREKLDVIQSANDIFDEGVIPILEEIAALDLEEAIYDLRKGNYLGNRKIDINLALNMNGITQDLIDNNPEQAETIWTDPAKTVLYDRADITFVDGEVIALPFLFDSNPINISTHGDLLIQLSRTDMLDDIAQVVTISNIVVVNDTLYRVTLNGVNFDYTSDADATEAEILTSLVQEININETNGSVPITASVVGSTIILTADTAGTLFTSSVNANMTIATTTDNQIAGTVETDFLAKLEDTNVSGFSADVVGEFVRIYDIVGSNSNIEKIVLHAVSGSYIEEYVTYFWAKTTSAFQTLSMRAGDIIKLGNDIDSIILLATSINEVLEIQSRLPQLVDTFVDDAAQGDVTIYNKLTELDAIHEELTGLIAIYDDIKVGGTNYIQTVSTNIADIGSVATDLNLGVDSKIVKTGSNIDNINSVAANETNINAVATNETNINSAVANEVNINKVVLNEVNINSVAANETNINAVVNNEVDISSVATNVVPNLAEILQADDNATIATTKAGEASASALSASDSATLASTKADTITAINGDQVAQTLSSGSVATAYYNSGTGKFTFGIPQGSKGEKGDPFEVNAVGLFASRSLYDTQVTGFSFLAVDQAEIYFKLSGTSGDWSVAAPFGKGETGNGIDNIAFTSTTAVSGLAGEAGETDTYTITYTDLTVTTFIVTNGLGIDSILFTSTTDGSGLVAQGGATDTYTITYSDATTDTIQVYNGLDSAVLSVAGRTGDIVLSKADVGLANVDNTSDEDKPVSSATQTALNLKAEKLQTSTTTTSYTDATTATPYKLYIDNGNIVMEEL